MKTYHTTNGGTFHPIKPFYFLPRFNVRRVEGTLRFTEASRYATTNTRNQADWNKGGGLSHSVLPNKHAIMLGWRYYKSQWELTPYINLNGEKYYTHPHLPPLQVEENCINTFAIEYHTSTNNTPHIHFTINGNVYLIDSFLPNGISYNKWSSLSFPRGLSFGGDDSPLQKLNVDFSCKFLKQ